MKMKEIKKKEAAENNWKKKRCTQVNGFLQTPNTKRKIWNFQNFLWIFFSCYFCPISHNNFIPLCFCFSFSFISLFFFFFCFLFARWKSQEKKYSFFSHLSVFLWSDNERQPSFDNKGCGNANIFWSSLVLLHRTLVFFLFLLLFFVFLGSHKAKWEL